MRATFLVRRERNGLIAVHLSAEPLRHGPQHYLTEAARRRSEKVSRASGERLSRRPARRAAARRGHAASSALKGHGPSVITRTKAVRQCLVQSHCDCSAMDSFKQDGRFPGNMIVAAHSEGFRSRAAFLHCAKRSFNRFRLADVAGECLQGGGRCASIAVFNKLRV
jgi:hypothetical protein